jgi:hypothetical protein
VPESGSVRAAAALAAVESLSGNSSLVRFLNSSMANTGSSPRVTTFSSLSAHVAAAAYRLQSGEETKMQEQGDAPEQTYSRTLVESDNSAFVLIGMSDGKRDMNAEEKG